MSTVIVTLVSEQTTPNVQFAKWCLEEKLIETADMVFITTKEMEEKNKSQLIVDALVESDFPFASDECKPIEVNPYDFETIRKNISDNIKIQEYEKVIVNITGGTKPMALTAYQFFSRFNNCEIYYQSINEKILKIYPEEKNIEANASISLEQLLIANGFTAEETGNFLKDYDFNKSFYDKCLKINVGGIRVITDLGKCKNLDGTFRISGMKQLNNYSNSDVQKALNIARYCGFDSEHITGQQADFMKGGSWFEEYVYQYVQNKFGIPDNRMALNMKVERENDKNELDVVYMTPDNTFHIIECKALVGRKDAGQTINDALYKLHSIEQKFGLKVKGHIYTKATNINAAYLSRAKEYDIEIIDGSMI